VTTEEKGKTQCNTLHDITAQHCQIMYSLYDVRGSYKYQKQLPFFFQPTRQNFPNFIVINVTIL